jgi:hypothetical protein
MITKILIAIAVILLYNGVSQEVREIDSVSVIDSASVIDSVVENSPSDSTFSSTAPSDTARTKKIQLVRRNFNYRYQVRAAMGMMIFITIILTTVQNWNPD